MKSQQEIEKEIERIKVIKKHCDSAHFDDRMCEASIEANRMIAVLEWVLGK